MARSREPPGLPKQQLLILSICRFAEPIALTSVFPYLPEMIESFDVPKNKVAGWAGITSAVFSLSQALTGVFWGRASDRFGRKPVILMGLLCTMLATLFFGFSRSLAWAIVARGLSGSVNGNVGVMRTTVAELVPQKELQPKAFSVLPLVWTIGTILGPGFGGALANPVARHPQIFGSSQFFKNYPFALPNLVASLFFLVGLSVGFLFLKETLETKKHCRDYGRILGKQVLRLFKDTNRTEWRDRGEQSRTLLKHSADDGTGANSQAVQRARPSYREVFTRQSNINLLVYTLLALHSVTYDQLLPIFMHYPRQEDRATNPRVRLPFKFSGGFGIDSDRIGLLFTAYGVCGMLIQFLVFPPVARHFGVLNCLKVVTILFPIVYILTPFAALLPSQLMQQVGLLAIMFIKCWGSIFAFPCTIILLTNSASSLRILGTLNGISTSVSALGRAVGPAIGGWAFSLGVDKGYVITPWWTLAAFAILGAVPVWWLIEMDGFGGGDETESESEEDEVLLPHEDELPKSDAIDIANVSPEEAGEDDEIATEDNLEPVNKLSRTLSHDGAHQSGFSNRRMSSPIRVRESVGPGGGG